MKRIIHVVSCLERGGTEAFIMNHYRAMERTEYQFDFLVFREKDYPYLGEIERLGGRVFFCVSPSRKKIVSSIAGMVRIMKKNGPYCAVHSNINIENAWVMVAAAIAGIPVRVSHSHGTKGKEGNCIVRLYRKFQNILIKVFATQYVGCGVEAGRYLYGEAFFDKKGKVIHNGIDVNRFISVPEEQIDTLRKSFSLDGPHGLVFGNITRFDDNKNQQFVLEVFQCIAEKYPDATLLLGGTDGGNLQMIKEKTRTLKLEKQVKFIGERNDIPACLKLIDIYLFPSLYEGLPIALLEAQAAGCYCIVSTAVSAESDIGLGRVLFCDLKDSSEHWFQMIEENAIGNPRPEAEKILKMFRKSGYDIHQSVKHLIQIYEKE